MERIQYNVIERDTKNASGKAKKDVGNILRINGFKNLYNPLEYRYFRGLLVGLNRIFVYLFNILLIYRSAITI